MSAAMPAVQPGVLRQSRVIPLLLWASAAFALLARAGKRAAVAAAAAAIILLLGDAYLSFAQYVLHRYVNRIGFWRRAPRSNRMC